jgi:hypothetical protein
MEPFNNLLSLTEGFQVKESFMPYSQRASEAFRVCIDFREEIYQRDEQVRIDVRFTDGEKGYLVPISGISNDIESKFDRSQVPIPEILGPCHDFGCFGFMIRCTPINPSKFLSYRQRLFPAHGNRSVLTMRNRARLQWDFAHD